MTVFCKLGIINHTGENTQGELRSQTLEPWRQCSCLRRGLVRTCPKLSGRGTFPFEFYRLLFSPKIAHFLCPYAQCYALISVWCISLCVLNFGSLSPPPPSLCYQGLFQAQVGRVLLLCEVGEQCFSEEAQGKVVAGTSSLSC